MLKEGLYQDPGNREQLLELVRYRSSSEDGLVSLAQYKERMSSDQKAIYYITGDRSADLRRSPLLEAYRAKGLILYETRCGLGARHRHHTRSRAQVVNRGHADDSGQRVRRRRNRALLAD